MVTSWIDLIVNKTELKNKETILDNIELINTINSNRNGIKLIYRNWVDWNDIEAEFYGI